MTFTTLPSGMVRETKFDSKPRKGLNDGDLVVFLDPVSGKPYTVAQKSPQDSDAPETVFLFGVDHGAAEISSFTPKTLERLQSHTEIHLEVQRHREFWGFRSVFANERLLQATRKGANRLRFHDHHFGTWEEWLLDSRYVQAVMDTSWDRIEVVFRHRRLEKLELKVVVVRLGKCEYDDTHALPASTPLALGKPGMTQSMPQSAARSSRYNSPASSLSMRPPLSSLRQMPGTGADGSRGDVTREHTSVLHAMSGAVAKEFVVALQREVKERASLEREVREMHLASDELRQWTLGELERLRSYGQTRVDEIAANFGGC